MKDLKFICAQPDDQYYLWQTHLWIESLKEIGHSDKAIVLVYTPKDREANGKWQELVTLYPEAEFFFHKDVDNVDKFFNIYIPILRPYILYQYFKLHPEMKDCAVMYCDCDVVFTKNLNINHLIQDDINYLSDTNSYINASYFDSKIKDVLPEKLEEYKTRDILAETTELAGITREIAEKNNLHSGGAQYLLKNIDAEFWKKVFQDALSIRKYLMSINKQFFKTEESGFQSWCADMWAVLWGVWARDQETKNAPEMEFAWASDPIERLNRVGIFHNAGITTQNMPGYPAFYKGAYHTGKNPFNDTHLQTVLNDENSKKYCTHYYVSKMFDINNKYNLNY
jgi:hypothetical protein